MNHVTGEARTQITLFPVAIEDYLTADNPVRYLDAFVDTLDMIVLGFQKAQLSETGRPPYNPGDLLRLYLYGYLNRVRSSRRLEQETHRNLEVMWLLKRLTPDHKTISDFRRENPAAIRSTCRRFILLCQRMNLFGGELVAIDGSKFAASNANRKNFTKAKLKDRIKRINTTIDEYLTLLETNDRQEIQVPRPDAATLSTKITELKERSAEYEQLLEQLEQTGESQASLTDPDSRLMSSHQGRDVCYNVQTVVDSKHKLIVDHLVTNEPNDRSLLSTMAIRAKRLLGTDQLVVCADKGYWSGTQIQKCDELNIVTYIPEHADTGIRSSGIPKPDYAHSKFVYDNERDGYRCPADQELTVSSRTMVNGRWRYDYRTPACAQCTVRLECTKNKNGRVIYRSELEETLHRARDRAREHPEILDQRKCLSEHPFGTIKHGWTQGYFLLRRLPLVRVEASLSVLTYNLKRAIHVVGVPTLLQHLTA